MTYRPTSLVGRDAELARLRSAWGLAATGHGSVLTLSGEPGIGKSALCRAFAGEASTDGGLVLTGHCYEAHVGAPPFGPFREVFRDLAARVAPDMLVRIVGDGINEIGQVAPEILRCLEVTPAIATEAGTRHLLFQAIAAALVRASVEQPTALVLEDLHDADADALDLLAHLARSLAGSRLL